MIHVRVRSALSLLLLLLAVGCTSVGHRDEHNTGARDCANASSGHSSAGDCPSARTKPAPPSPAAQVPPKEPACCVSIRLLTEVGISKLSVLLKLMQQRNEATLRPVADLDGAPIRTVWERTFGFRLGPYKDMERYFCRTNQHICGSDGKTKPQPAASGTSTNVSGLNCSGKLPSYVVCLPNLKIVSYQETLTRQIARSHTSYSRLGKLVTETLGGCTAWDDTCQRLLANLNTSRPGAVAVKTSYAGPIRLPFAAISVLLAGKKAESLPALKARGDDLFGAFLSQANLLKDSDRYAAITDAPAHPIARSLLLTSMSDGDTLNRTVLASAKYPFSNAKLLQAISSVDPVVVGIWDKFVDDRHCDFQLINGSAIRFADPDSRASLDSAHLLPSPPAGSNCNYVRSEGADEVDHGTAVAGAIVSQQKAGFPGVNPKAQIWTADIDRVFGADSPWGPEPVTGFVQQKGQPVAVINISQDVEDLDQSQVDRVLFGDDTASDRNRLADDIVITAAAGNDGHFYSDGGACPIYPACVGTRGTLTGLITVTAIAPSGDRVLSCDDLKDAGISKSDCTVGPASAVSYGDAFDVGAPGLAFTTLSGDGFGVVAGTSVAAPRVAGLASLLIASVHKAIARTPPAIDTKTRILMTSDPLEDGAGRRVARFGQINIERAIGYASDFVLPKRVYQDDITCAGVADCKLTNFKLVRRSDSAIVGHDNVANRDTNIRVADLLRLQATDKPDTFRVYHLRATGDRQPRPIDVDTLSFGTSELLQFVSPTGQSRRFLVDQLEEFTACSFLPGCPSAAP